jgi:lipoprotein-anchoring transpeptidase ErfK/SrfK
MSRKFSLALLASASLLCATTDPAAAQSAQPVRVTSNMGGGFIEFLFGDAPRGGRYEQYQQQPDVGFDGRRMPDQQGNYRQQEADPGQRSFDPRYNKQVVEYHGNEGAGTVVIDTPNKFLYLVQGDGKALRYGVGVGRPGFTWSGTKTISAKKEWPAWTPPPEMLARRPDLPRHMEGGQDNPLGARAMYLGSSLYRIHGSNEPWTIGTNVSSGCIRMRNEDVIDLYGRVGVGTRVVVI